MGGMLLIDFREFSARLLYKDGLGGRWVIDIHADYVRSEVFDGGYCVGASQTSYDFQSPSLQSQFSPVVYWAIKGLHGVPLELRGSGKSKS